MAVSIYDSTPNLLNPAAAYSPSTNPGITVYEGVALGGYRSYLTKVARFNPRLQQNAYRLFPDLLSTQLTSGVTHYRCVFFQTDTALTHLWVWLGAATTAGNASIAMAIGADPAGANSKAAVIANDTSVPAGVTFTSPVTQGTAIDLGPLTAGQSKALWIRRTVSASAPSFQADNFTLNYQDATNNITGEMIVWWNDLAGTGFGTIPSTNITNDRTTVGKRVTTQEGINFTINTVNASTGATQDPANQEVWVFIAQSVRSTPFNGPLNGVYGQLFVAKAQRTGVGTFTYGFFPPAPGQYEVTFSIAEDEWATSVFCSPT